MSAPNEVELVHYCDYAAQPTIHIACGLASTASWTQPAWGQARDVEEPYRADNGKLYTFGDELVTCERCRMVMAIYALNEKEPI